MTSNLSNLSLIKNIISIDLLIGELSNDILNLDQRQSFGKISDSYMWFVPELFERQDVISSFKIKLKSSLKKDFLWINASASASDAVVNDDDDDNDDFVEQIKKLRDNPSQNKLINHVIKVDDVDTNGIDIQNQKS